MYNDIFDLTTLKSKAKYMLYQKSRSSNCINRIYDNLVSQNAKFLPRFRTWKTFDEQRYNFPRSVFVRMASICIVTFLI